MKATTEIAILDPMPYSQISHIVGKVNADHIGIFSPKTIMVTSAEKREGEPLYLGLSYEPDTWVARLVQGIPGTLVINALDVYDATSFAAFSARIPHPMDWDSVRALRGLGPLAPPRTMSRIS